MHRTGGPRLVAAGGDRPAADGAIPPCFPPDPRVFPAVLAGNRARIARVTLRSRPLNPFGGRRDQRNERTQEPPANKKEKPFDPAADSPPDRTNFGRRERPPSTPRVDQGGPSGCFIRAGPLLSRPSGPRFGVHVQAGLAWAFTRQAGLAWAAAVPRAVLAATIRASTLMARIGDGAITD